MAEKVTSSSSNHEFWPMTLKSELDPYDAKENQYAKDHSQKSFSSKAIYCPVSKTHTLDTLPYLDHKSGR